MIVYRPHRGSFDAAMEEAKEFPSVEKMFLHIVQEETDNSPFHIAPFSVDDLVICGAPISDYRNGWQDYALCLHAPILQ